MDAHVSIQGDVYSYGVLLLELFTGKRPTDGSFQGGQTLQSYVAACYPDKIMEIVDPTLLPLDNGCLSKGGIFLQRNWCWEGNDLSSWFAMLPGVIKS